MGLTDRLKAVAKQAQEAVGEHSDKLHEAVETVGVAVNEKTQGKYASKIAKAGEKTNEAIDKLGGSGSPDETSDAAAPTEHAPDPAPTEPAATNQAPPPSSDSPSFDE
jgi:hypothetical protein